MLKGLDLKTTLAEMARLHGELGVLLAPSHQNIAGPVRKSSRLAFDAEAAMKLETELLQLEKEYDDGSCDINRMDAEHIRDELKRMKRDYFLLL